MLERLDEDPGGWRQHAARVESLDVVRGCCVIAMMLVDWPGNWDTRHALFEHARWLGITPPDFIFPTFLFLMGMAIPLSLHRARASKPDLRTYLKVGRRAVTLFALGYFLNLVWDCPPTVLPIDWSCLRILGVLQRFGLVYPVAAIAYLKLPPRKVAWLAAAIVVAYGIALTMVPVPGFGPPDLARHPEGQVIPNLATWLDHVVLGCHVYSYPYDPEGLASTFASISSVLLGVVAGGYLFRPPVTAPPAAERLNVLFTWALALLVIGYLGNQVLPWSKKLWTGSFVLFTVGWALVFAGVAYARLDLHRDRPPPRWRQWVLALPRWYGSNAIAAIVTFTVIDNITSRWPVGRRPDGKIYALKDWLFDVLCKGMSGRNASWVYSVLAIGLLSLLFRALYRRRLFLRV